MPLEWISNYKNLKKNSIPALTTEATFKRCVDRTVKTIVKKSDEEKSPSGKPPVFCTMMITPKTAEKETTNPCY